MDYPGSVLSVLGISLLVIGVSMGGTLGWSSPIVIGSFVGAGVVFIAFIVLQNRRLHPLIDISLFKDRVVSSLYISGFFSAISNYAIVLLASLYLQGVQGLSAIDAGLRILPVPIGTMVAAAIAGRLARSIDARWLTASGMLLVSVGALLFAANLREDTSYVAIAIPLLLVGVGVGTFMTPNTTALMARVPSTRRGIANAVRSTLQNAGYLFSTALALAIATGGLTGAQQLAAYKGTLFGMKSHDLAAFVSGVTNALVLFGILALIGAIVSLIGTRPGRGPLPLAPGVVSPEL